MADLLTVIGAGLLAWLTAWTCNSRALRPWRAAQGAHWTERARRLHPARAAAISNQSTVPLLLAVACLCWRREATFLALAAGLAAWVGVVAASVQFDSEVFPDLTRRYLWRCSFTNGIMRFGRWLVLFGVMVAMPRAMNRRALLLGGGVLVLHAAWVGGGMIWVGRALGLIQPAPERLRALVAGVADRMRVAVRRVWVFDNPLGGAVALPLIGEVMFSRRTLERHPDDEIAAIGAHELAHLSEQGTTRAVRFLGSLAFAPWLYLRPLAATYGIFGLLGVVATSLLMLRATQRWVRKLEVRADRIALAHEAAGGAYARALARLHEDMLVPAVYPSPRTSHPHLYDRMLAAGVTPDFPRPAAPVAMAAHGRVFKTLFSALAGVAVALWLG